MLSSMNTAIKLAFTFWVFGVFRMICATYARALYMQNDRLNISNLCAFFDSTMEYFRWFHKTGLETNDFEKPNYRIHRIRFKCDKWLLFNCLVEWKMPCIKSYSLCVCNNLGSTECRERSNDRSPESNQTNIHVSSIEMIPIINRKCRKAADMHRRQKECRHTPD